MRSKSSLLSFLRQASHIIPVLLCFIYCPIAGTLYAQQKVTEDLFSVSFPNERQGWACGRWGTVVHTADGGKTWKRQHTGTDYTLGAIYFVDTHHGWAVGDEGTIIHSKDGGKTWRQQKSPVPFRLMDVHFEGLSKGWIVTEQTHILFTDDGGENWRIQFRDEDFILKAISFADDLHGWAVGEYGFIYHTTDGGSTWEKQAGYFRISDETGEVEAGSFLFGVIAMDPERAWAVGIDGYVIKTEDGGKSWQEVKVGAPKTQLFCIASDRQEVILIGGNRTFLSSSDGGRTWHSPTFRPSITYGWIYGLAQRGSSGFVAVGWEGTIYLDASSSWYRASYE